MANKPFAIQGADLTLGGVNLQAGTTGVVIPGVTQATSYRVEEVEDTGDQTRSFQSIPVVIDYQIFIDYMNNGSSTGRAVYTVDELDGDGFIDGISVDAPGSYTANERSAAIGNDLHAYIGTAVGDEFNPFVPTDWDIIPFRPKMRAGEIETIGGGGGGSSITNGGESFSINGDGDVKFDGIGMGGIDRGVVWQYGDNNDGINSMVRQDGSGLTVRAWTTDGGGGPTGGEGGYSAPVNIVTNQDANAKTWTFDGAGNLTFPDGSIQTTAYTASTLKTFYLNDYGGIDPIEEPIEIVIDGMSYEGGNIVSDGAFGPGSSRVTLYADSMFAIVAVNSTATDVYYNGEMGADSSGQKIKTDLLIENYRGYYASSCLYSNTGDPCISQIVISKGTTPTTAFHQNAGDTNVDDFHVSGVGSGTVIVLNVYWNSQSDPFNASVQLAAQTFIDTVIFDGGDERTNIALMASAFYAGSAAIRSTIENYAGNLLYSNFDFYEGEQVVRPTGGTGTGFIALVSGLSGQTYNDEFVIKPGTGYSEDDILTVPGSEFGGTSPANDVTITVTGVDGTGGITGWSIAGTVPSQVWPGSFIIDGDEDQYDTGNFIGTNFTRVTANVTVETVELEANDVTKMTVISADKDVSIGQFAFFNGQNRGDYIVYADSYGINNTAEYFDSNTGYVSTQSLTYDFAVDVDNSHVTLNGAGDWSIGSNNLNTKIFSTDEIDPEDRDIVIMAGSQNNNWMFGRDGRLSLPQGGDIVDSNGQSVLGGSTAQLVGDGYVEGTGFKRTVYTNWQGQQGGESNGELFNETDVNGFAVGDSITFRNGEVRTITSFDTGYSPQVYVQWDSSVVGDTFDNPRYPAVFTSANYVEETKKTARIKPDSNLVGTGQYMEVYAGGPTVLENKHIHMAGANADTNLFLGTDNNFVSTKEAGLSPAQVNLKSENDITVSDTNLRMTRGNTWISIYGDSYNTDWRDNNQDLSWDLVETDDQGNFYVGGESHWGSEAMVAKYGPDGDLIWKKIVNSQNTSGWNTQGAAYNPVDKEVAFAIETGINRSYDYAKVTVFDSDTGDVKRTFDVYDPDGSVYVRAMSWHPTLGYMAVGNTSGESASTGSITAIGATGTGIIELPRTSVKIGGQWPQFWGSWRISGTGITGSQTLQGGVGLYYAPVINLTNPSSTGMTTGIRVDYSGLYYENYTQGTAGTGTWDNGDSFKILGSNLGGIDGDTTVVASPNSLTPHDGIVSMYFTKTSYPDLYNQLQACSWTAGYNSGGPYNIIAVADAGANWQVDINSVDTTIDAVSFYTASGNDITGLIQDNNNIQNGFSGSPSPVANYRLDMGYNMGYGTTDFTGGTFTITTTLDNTAFVWSDSWSKIFKAENGSTSYAYSIAVDKVYGDIVVGGYENGASRNFVWKLDSNGSTQWVKRIDDDNNDVFSVAISSVSRDIYFTTGYNSVNKLDSNGNLVDRVEPQGMWGHNNPIVKLEQRLDGEEYLYVGGSYGSVWSNNQSGFMVTKLDSDLKIMWTRSIRNNNRSLDTHYDSFHNNFALGRDKVVLAGYTYFSSFNYDVAFLASITTDDNFDTGQMGQDGEWYLEVLANDITYPNQTNNYAIENCLVNGAATANSTLQLDTEPNGFDLTNWTWKTGLVKLDTTLNGIVGVESIAFAEGGLLDHNPSDIPPVVTDFSQMGWNYTLKLSDRGKFIKNGEGVENYTGNLYITVPSQWNLSFPVGSVITLINLSDANSSGNRIYVQPENFGDNDCPRIYATGYGTTWSTWSFQGVQTATLMKIGSNDWLLTANDIANED